MTPEQKLEIVYKKLFNQKAYTKQGTQFFEEPLSTFSQVPLSYVYVNSDYIPTVAPKQSITVAGSDVLTYVEKEKSVSIDSKGKKFKTRNGRLIPKSYGTGYDIEIRTKSGQLIDQGEFPYLIDWESGTITFDDTPFDVDFHNPPLISYHFYSGKTLENISGFSVPGPRGAIGPTGETGPIDDSVLVYRGQTDFTASPAVEYKPNDVITFTTNGNSYICVLQTDESPVASPGSWENISPSGTAQDMPENVLYVYHPNSIPMSGLLNGSLFYFTSLQDAIDHAQDGVHTTIVVNQLSNLYPIETQNILIENKNLNIVFRKWANVSSDLMVSSGFSLSIKDSDVIIQDAYIGGNFMFKSYDGTNELLIDAVSADTNVKFIGCRINSKLVKTTRSSDYNSTVTFERCSMNSERLVTNADLILKDSTFSGSLTGDYRADEVQGLKHRFHVINSFGFQKMTRGSLRNITAYDVVLLVNRNDLQNLSVKFENSMMPAVGVAFYPEVFTYSPDVLTVDANNTMFDHFGLDESSSYHEGKINVVGSNVSYGVNFNNFTTQFFSLEEPYNPLQTTFYFSLDGQGGGQIPVVTWDATTLQAIRYEAYKSLVTDQIERGMLSL